jgi:hypothetical protein
VPPGGWSCVVCSCSLAPSRLCILGTARRYAFFTAPGKLRYFVPWLADSKRRRAVGFWVYGLLNFSRLFQVERWRTAPGCIRSIRSPLDLARPQHPVDAADAQGISSTDWGMPYCHSALGQHLPVSAALWSLPGDAPWPLRRPAPQRPLRQLTQLTLPPAGSTVVPSHTRSG